MEEVDEEDSPDDGLSRELIAENQHENPRQNDTSALQANNLSVMNTSLISAQSFTRNADVLAQHLNTEELEAIAVCYDNIRHMRRTNQQMVDNDDTELGNIFDENLTQMIASLTEELK